MKIRPEITEILGLIVAKSYTTTRSKKGEVEIRGEVENDNGALHFYPYKITQGKTVIELADDEGVPKVQL